MRKQVKGYDRSEAVTSNGEVAVVLWISHHKERMQSIHLAGHSVNDGLTILRARVEQNVDQSIVGIIA